MSRALSQPLQTNCSRLLRRALRAHDGGELAKAERLYNAVLRHHPDNFDALHGLGRLHFQHRRYDTALVLFQAALQNDGSRAEGFSSLGLAFHCLGRLKHALKSYEAGLSLDPGNAEILNRRGVALLELRRPLDAITDFEQVLADNAGHLDALGNYGNALVKLNRPQDALVAYDRALMLAPENAQLLTNRAAALRRLDRPREALMSASRALVAKPDFAEARFVESLARLTLGDFAGGWRGYEARWSVGLLAAQRRLFAAPLWRGEEPVGGKTILLHAEQGFGDAIQFVRYAPLLARRGATVILEVRRELIPLLSGLPGIAAIVAFGDPLPDFELHCPLMSLPLNFATELSTIPAQIPYLAAAGDRMTVWRDRLPNTRPLIGLVWSGEPSHDNDLNRSVELATLAPLFDLPDLTFVSLQHDVRERDAPALRNATKLVQLAPRFGDFADTAAVVALLDAVVAVDTAVAHLTGALGKPLLLLVPFAADFRWLRERTDSPWYPTAQLYRQPAFGDWNGAIATVAADLARMKFTPASHKLSA